jgi:DNA-binding NarL/FixJ family response regulator
VAVQLVHALKPDVLLIDLSMPVMTGLDALRALTDSGSSCRVMLLTAAIDRNQTLEALQLGARGVVPKESATATLFKGIRVVMKDEYWVGRESVSDVIRYLREATRKDTSSRAKFGLTARELQVVAAVVDGSSNKDIAKLYSLSEDTVKHHLSSIFDKAGVSSRLELALFAINHALVDRDIAV